MRISDWSSDVCSSDLRVRFGKDGNVLVEVACRPQPRAAVLARERGQRPHNVDEIFEVALGPLPHVLVTMRQLRKGTGVDFDGLGQVERDRSEEHTSELQSLMRISYAVFCLKKKTKY